AFIVVSCCVLVCILYQEPVEAQSWRGFRAGLVAAGVLAALATVPLMLAAKTVPVGDSKRPWACAQSLGALGSGTAPDRALHGDKPCADGLAGLLKRLWSFLVSDEGHFLFASAATLRAFFFYLRRSPLPEANHFADYLIAALILIILAGL